MDRWHRWLRETRFGGDPVCRDKNFAEFLYPVRDTVLDKARLLPGETLLDVGAGDGLIGFAALDRDAGLVIFSDISGDLVDHCRRVAEAEGQRDRCDFVLASADRLTGVTDESVDVVTTRSVLIYVKNKAAAFAEFFRVLRPGGRISLYEPINILMSVCDPDLFWGYDVTPVKELAAKVELVYAAIQVPGEDPMIDFDERDLVRLAHDVGFPEVELELRVSVKSRKPPMPWERFLRMSGNPLIPKFGEALEQALRPDERAEFTAHLRPLVESGTGHERRAGAYLTAVKGRKPRG